MPSYDASATAFVLHPLYVFRTGQHCHGKQKGAINEWTNEGVYDGC